VQVRGERLALRAGEKLLAVVEAAAVDRPQLAEYAAPGIFGPLRRDSEWSSITK